MAADVVYRAIADFSRVRREVRHLRREMRDLRREEERANAASLASSQRLAAEREALADKVQAASRAGTRVITAGLGDEDRAARVATSAIRNLAEMHEAARASIRGADGAVDAHRDTLRGLGRDAEVTADSLSGAQRAARAAGEEIRRLGGGRPFNGVADSARDATSATERLHDSLQETSAAADGAGGGDDDVFGPLGHSADRAGGGLGRMGTKIALISGLILILGGAISPLIASLGGLVAALLGVATAVGQSLGALAAFPAAIAAVIGIVGTLKLALGGAGEAFKAFGQAQKAQKQAAADSARTQRDNARALRDATEAVKDAQEAQAESAESYQERVQRAEKALQREREDSARSAERNRKRIVDADKAAARASDDVIDAQKRVSKARKAAERYVRDLRREVERAAQAERDARAGALSARDRYYEVMADATATPGERAEALAALRRAEERVTEVQEKNADNASELRDIEREGLESVPALRNAIDALTAAQERATRATENASEARSEADRQAMNWSDRIIDAEERLTEARRDQGRAAEDAADRVRDAQERLADVQEKVAEGSATAATAAAAYEAALADLHPATRRVVEALAAQYERWQDLKRAVSGAFFGPIEGQIENLISLLGPLEGMLTNIAAGLGRAAAGIIEQMSGPRFTEDMKVFGAQMATALDAATPGLRRLIGAFGTLTTVAMDHFLIPTIEAFSTLSARFDDFIIEAEKSGALAGMFEKARERLSQIGRVLGRLTMAFVHLFAAADPFTDWLMGIGENGEETGRGILGWTSRVEAWSKRMREEDSPFRNWLESIQPMLTEMAAFFGAFGRGLASMSADPANIKAATEIWVTLREDVLPALISLLDTLSKSGAFNAFLEFLANFLGFLDNLIGGGGGGLVRGFVEALNAIFAALRFISGIPGVGPLLGAIAAALGVIAALRLAGAVTGVTRLSRAIRGLRGGQGILGGLLDRLRGINEMGPDGRGRNRPGGGPDATQNMRFESGVKKVFVVNWPLGFDGRGGGPGRGGPVPVGGPGGPNRRQPGPGQLPLPGMEDYDRRSDRRRFEDPDLAGPDRRTPTPGPGAGPRRGLPLLLAPFRTGTGGLGGAPRAGGRPGPARPGGGPAPAPRGGGPRGGPRLSGDRGGIRPVRAGFGAAGMAAMLASSFMPMPGGTAGSALSGAVTGGSLGMMAGPIGAAVGATAGAAIGAIIPNWDRIKSTVKKAGDELRTEMRESGKDSGEGFISGMGRAISIINSKIAEWFTRHVIDPVKRFFGIASPSTVLAAIGADVIAGFIQGMLGGFPDLLARLGVWWGRLLEDARLWMGRLPGVVAGALGSLGSVLVGVLAGLLPSAAGAWDRLLGVFRKLPVLPDLFGRLFTWVSDATGRMRQPIADLFGRMWGGVRDATNRGIDLLNRGIGFLNVPLRFVSGGRLAVPAIPRLNSGGAVGDSTRLRQRGGTVPGTGDHDKVPTLLTPGEFVLNKKASKRIGVSALRKMNALGLNAGGFVQRLVAGGPVRATTFSGPAGGVNARLEQAGYIIPDHLAAVPLRGEPGRARKWRPGSSDRYAIQERVRLPGNRTASTVTYYRMFDGAPGARAAPTPAPVQTTPVRATPPYVPAGAVSGAPRGAAGPSGPQRAAQAAQAAALMAARGGAQGVAGLTALMARGRGALASRRGGPDVPTRAASSANFDRTKAAQFRTAFRSRLFASGGLVQGLAEGGPVQALGLGSLVQRAWESIKKPVHQAARGVRQAVQPVINFVRPKVEAGIHAVRNGIGSVGAVGANLVSGGIESAHKLLATAFPDAATSYVPGVLRGAGSMTVDATAARLRSPEGLVAGGPVPTMGPRRGLENLDPVTGLGLDNLSLLSRFGALDAPFPAANLAPAANSVSSTSTVNKGMTIENLNINNPFPERASDSLPRRVRQMQFLGSLG